VKKGGGALQKTNMVVRERCKICVAEYLGRSLKRTSQEGRKRGELSTEKEHQESKSEGAF